MIWTEKDIENYIFKLMKELSIDRMPTSMEMRDNHLSGLGRAITLKGGFLKWAKKLNIPMKERETLWTDERIEKEIFSCMKSLDLKRMPTASEFKSLGRNDLHCKISKGKKYRGWAKELGLELKESETKTGNEYEEHVKELLEKLGLNVKRMTTKHPYDLLVNDCVKVDVKAGVAHNHFGSRAHTFHLTKKYATCDLYICVALNENQEVENYFIVPSTHAQVITMNIGTDSKYNQFINRWHFLKEFVSKYENAIRLGNF